MESVFTDLSEPFLRTRLIFDEPCINDKHENRTRRSSATPFPHLDLSESEEIASDGIRVVEDISDLNSLSKLTSEIKNGYHARHVQLQHLQLRINETRQHGSEVSQPAKWFIELLKDDLENYELITCGISTQAGYEAITQNKLDRGILKLMIVKRHILSFLRHSIQQWTTLAESSLKPDIRHLMKFLRSLTVGESRGADSSIDDKINFDLFTHSHRLSLPISSDIASLLEDDNTMPVECPWGNYIKAEIDFLENLSPKAIDILPPHKCAYYLLKYFRKIYRSHIGTKLVFMVLNALRRATHTPIEYNANVPDLSSLSSTIFLQFISLCFIESEISYRKENEVISDDRLVGTLLIQARTLVHGVWVERIEEFDDHLMWLSIGLSLALWPEEKLGDCLHLLNEVQPIIRGNGRRSLSNCFSFISIYQLYSHFDIQDVDIMNHHLHCVLQAYSSVVEEILVNEYILFSNQQLKSVLSNGSPFSTSAFVSSWVIQAIIWRIMMVNEKVIPKSTLLGLMSSSILRPHDELRSNSEFLSRMGLCRALIYAVSSVGDPEDIDLLIETTLGSSESILGSLLALTIRETCLYLSNCFELYTHRDHYRMDACIVLKSLSLSLRNDLSWSLCLLQLCLSVLYPSDPEMSNRGTTCANEIVKWMIKGLLENDNDDGDHPDICGARLMTFFYLMLLNGEIESLSNMLTDFPKVVARLEVSGMSKSVKEEISRFLGTVSILVQEKCSR